MNLVLEEKLKIWREGLELKKPGLYDVILHNDDFTPMTFVMEILKDIFNLDDIKANKVMLEAHTKGRAVCGTYSKDIAETRMDQAAEYARRHDHPLRWSVEGA